MSKYGPEKTPYLDTFHAVQLKLSFNYNKLIRQIGRKRAFSSYASFKKFYGKIWAGMFVLTQENMYS